MKPNKCFWLIWHLIWLIFIIIFFKHPVTCDSLRLRSAASLLRSVLLMYFCLRKVLSSSFRCSSENTARLRIPRRDFGLMSAGHIWIFAPPSGTWRETHTPNSARWASLPWLSTTHWFVVDIPVDYTGCDWNADYTDENSEMRWKVSKT